MDEDMNTISDEDVMWYIGSACDGDGCVTCTMPYFIRFCIGQAEKSIAVLHFIQKRFGGNIIKHKPHEKWEQFYELTICAPAAMSVCARLAPYMYIKRDQFELAATWPLTMNRRLQLTHKKTGETTSYKNAAECERSFGLNKEAVSRWLRGSKQIEMESLKHFHIQWEGVDKEEIQARRQHIRDKLFELKHTPHSSIEPCVKLNYAYAAGFTDTDGNLFVNKSYVIVTIGQKYRAICDAFKQSFGGSVHVKKTAFHWVIGGYSAREFLADIYPYLIGKRKQAAIILSMKPGDGKKVSEELSKLNGGQKGQSRESRLKRAAVDTPKEATVSMV